MAERTQDKAGFGGLACGEGDPLRQLEGSTVLRMQDTRNRRKRLPHLLW